MQYGPLIKFGSLEHMTRLRDLGEVYMNTLPHFWRIEDGEVRGDLDDGVIAINQGTSDEPGVRMCIRSDDGPWVPIRFQSFHWRKMPREPERFNIYCMTLLRPGQAVSERFSEFGDTAVVFSNPLPFIERFANTAGEISFVEYRDVECIPDRHSGEVGLFRKLQKFAWQSEWRLVVDYGPGEALPLRIGDLRGMSKIVRTADLGRSVVANA